MNAQLSMQSTFATKITTVIGPDYATINPWHQPQGLKGTPVPYVLF